MLIFYEGRPREEEARSVGKEERERKALPRRNGKYEISKIRRETETNPCRDSGPSGTNGSTGYVSMNFLYKTAVFHHIFHHHCQQ